MSLKRSSRVLVGAVASTALATVGLTAVAAAPAAAAPTVTHYSCTFPVVGAVDVPVTLDLATLPAELPVDVPVPAGSLPISAGLDLPLALVAAILATLTSQVAPGAPGFSVLIGSLPVPAPLSAPLTTLPVGSGLSVPMTGSLGSFTPTVPGTLPVTLPGSFDLAGFPLALIGGTGLVPCTLVGSGTVGTVTVTQPGSGSGTGSGTKQGSRTRVKLLNAPVTPDERAKLRVRVKNALGTPAAGAVIAKLKGKKVGTASLKGGKARLRLPRLAVGTWKVKVKYLGDAATAKSKKVVTVRVVR